MNTDTIRTVQDIRSALIHLLVINFKGTPIRIEYVPSDYQIPVKVLTKV